MTAPIIYYLPTPLYHYHPCMLLPLPAAAPSGDGCDDEVIPLPYYSTVFHGDLSQRIVDCCRFNQTYITVDLSATFDLILFLFVDLVSLFIVW